MTFLQVIGLIKPYQIPLIFKRFNFLDGILDGVEVILSSMVSPLNITDISYSRTIFHYNVVKISNKYELVNNVLSISTLSPACKFQIVMKVKFHLYLWKCFPLAYVCIPIYICTIPNNNFVSSYKTSDV